MDLKESLKYLKMRESMISLLLGIFVILFSGILLVKYFTADKEGQFTSLDLGDITPNLTQAFPREDTISQVTTPTVTPSVNNPENTSSTNTEAKTYTVEKGDTLWNIAERAYNSGYNWIDIAEANKITNANQIEVGQVIFMPNVNPRTSTIQTADTTTTGNSITENSYTVEKGDSLWTIAVRAYGDGYKWSEISRENKIVHPNIIHKGNVLTIPR